MCGVSPEEHSSFKFDSKYAPDRPRGAEDAPRKIGLIPVQSPLRSRLGKPASLYVIERPGQRGPFRAATVARSARMFMKLLAKMRSRPPGRRLASQSDPRRTTSRTPSRGTHSRFTSSCGGAAHDRTEEASFGREERPRGHRGLDRSSRPGRRAPRLSPKEGREALPTVTPQPLGFAPAGAERIPVVIGGVDPKFRRKGASCLEARASEVSRRLAANRPQIILCDIGLPVMDGCGVAREIRADPALASVSWSR
jgi:hypothetical protein